jgi:hypothetical protein
MAGGVTRATRVRAGALAALALCLHCTPGLALDDPTRPPPGLRASVARSTPADELVLQSVIISPAGRSAIISGEHVSVGGKIGGARLVQVSEGAVVLLVGTTPRRLELFPGIHKRQGTRERVEE